MEGGETTEGSTIVHGGLRSTVIFPNAVSTEKKKTRNLANVCLLVLLLLY